MKLSFAPRVLALVIGSLLHNPTCGLLGGNLWSIPIICTPAVGGIHLSCLWSFCRSLHWNSLLSLPHPASVLEDSWCHRCLSDYSGGAIPASLSLTPLPRAGTKVAPCAIHPVLTSRGMHKPCSSFHSSFSWLGQCLFTYVRVNQPCTVHVFTSASSCVGVHTWRAVLLTPTSVSASKISHQRFQVGQTCLIIIDILIILLPVEEFSNRSCAPQPLAATIRLISFLFFSGRWELRGWPNPLNLPKTRKRPWFPFGAAI